LQVGADGLDQLIADRVERIEAGQRILEDHADALAADPAHRLRRQIVDAQAGQRISPPAMRPGGSSRPMIASAGERFAGAGFADHAQHLARRDVEADAVDRAQRAAAGGEFD
jgi:hypothetical protein